MGVIHFLICVRKHESNLPINICAKRISSCSDLSVLIRCLDMKPLGVRLPLRHCVRKLICALVLPMVLQVFSSDANIPLQVNIEKK